MTGDLFANEPPHNLLPFDGEALLLREVMAAGDADRTFERLLSGIVWQQEVARLMGARNCRAAIDGVVWRCGLSL